jgi:hypothetical protein
MWALTGSGCVVPRIRQSLLPPPGNPMPVQARNEDVMWERTVDVLHDYHFTVERENRVARVIETAPRVGSSLMEPWNRDSVGLPNRLESTLQSIRRRVVITFILGDAQGTYMVQVQAFKEKEDSRAANIQSAGGSTFLESDPLWVNLDPVVGSSTVAGYIPLGRDAELEKSLLHSLQMAYQR